MYTQNLIVLDLRNTLPNLKTLLLSLSYDPSHSYVLPLHLKALTDEKYRSFASSILITKPISPLISLSLETNPTDDLPHTTLSQVVEESTTPKANSLRSISPTPTITKTPKGRLQNGLEKQAAVGNVGMKGREAVGRGKGKNIEIARKLGRIS